MGSIFYITLFPHEMTPTAHLLLQTSNVFATFFAEMCATGRKNFANQWHRTDTAQNYAMEMFSSHIFTYSTVIYQSTITV